MNDKDTGGSAFPFPAFEYPDGAFNPGESGMTLRDYFAAKAMQGSRARNSNYESWSDLAKDAYEIADAMIQARKA